METAKILGDALAVVGLMVFLLLALWAVLGVLILALPKRRTRARAIPAGTALGRVTRDELERVHAQRLAYDKEHRAELRARFA